MIVTGASLISLGLILFGAIFPRDKAHADKFISTTCHTTAFFVAPSDILISCFTRAHPQKQWDNLTTIAVCDDITRRPWCIDQSEQVYGVNRTDWVCTELPDNGIPTAGDTRPNLTQSPGAFCLALLGGLGLSVCFAGFCVYTDETKR